jgi:hypothetical protein
MRSEYRCPRCLRVVGPVTVAGPSRVSLSPCGHRVATPDELLEMGDLHPPRPDVWVTDFLAESDDPPADAFGPPLFSHSFIFERYRHELGLVYYTNLRVFIFALAGD